MCKNLSANVSGHLSHWYTFGNMYKDGLTLFLVKEEEFQCTRDKLIAKAENGGGELMMELNALLESAHIIRKHILNAKSWIFYVSQKLFHEKLKYSLIGVSQERIPFIF